MGEGCLMIAPIGFLTIAAALFCLLLGNGATVRILSVSAVLGSAAALLVGATNIQPGHLVLGFLLVSVLARPRDTAAMLAALSAPRPGFWLAALTVYGVLSAYFAPRLFAGMTNIIPLGSTAFADTGGTQPLGPVSSNLTQSIYLVGGLLCFAMTSAVASTERDDAVRAAHSRPRSRCITRTSYRVEPASSPAAFNRDASSSAIATLRCLPPVQPTLIVM